MSEAKKPDVKPEPQPQLQLQDIPSLVQKTVEALLPAVMLASQPKQQAPAQHISNRARCGECGQVLETGCKGKHAQMVVLPLRRPEYQDCFQGVVLNGVKYLSTFDTEKVTVPESAVPGIQAMIDAYEQNESETRQGRKKQKNRSGPAQPAVDGWR